MIDQHLLVAVTSSATLNVREGRIGLDESWSPYVQGEIVTPLTDVDDLDPRENARILLEIQRDFGDVWTNADFTAAHPIPATNAQLTAAYPSWTNAQITAQFFRPWNSFGVRDSQVRSLDLVVRSVTVDHVAQTVTVGVASDEALLQDFGLVDDQKYVNATTSLRALVAYVLGLIGADLEDGTFDALIVAGDLEWLPGDDAFGYVQPAIEAADARLWCDENRLWYLTERTPLASGTLVLATGESGSITRARDVLDRDGDWYDAVVVTYRWTDALGATQIAYDLAGDPATATKVKSVIREQSYPGAGAAAALLSRAGGRGRVLDIDAVSDYTAMPGQGFSASLPDTLTQTGVLSAVTWHFPDAVMQVTTRGLTDTPSTAWVFDPAGIGWDDIPAGTDWTEDL